MHHALAKNPVSQRSIEGPVSLSIMAAASLHVWALEQVHTSGNPLQKSKSQPGSSTFVALHLFSSQNRISNARVSRSRCSGKEGAGYLRELSAEAEQVPASRCDYKEVHAVVQAAPEVHPAHAPDCWRVLVVLVYFILHSNVTLH